MTPRFRPANVRSRSRARACGAVFAAAALGSALSPTRPALADVESDGPDGDPKPRQLDPGISTGSPIVYFARPAAAPSHLRACSSRVPVCTHAASARDAGAALVVLDAFERQWLTLTGALAIPKPDVDPDTLAYDVFLDEPAASGDLGATFFEARDVRSRVDRGRSFTTIDRRVRAGCALDAVAAGAIARASLFRAAPATEEATARAQSAYLASLAVPCAVGSSSAAIEAFQSRPQRAISDSHAGDETAEGGRPSSALPLDHAFADGAALFWSRLDWAFGRSPGGVVTSTWALHPTMTALAARRWNNEPDTFDVLRATFKGALTTGGTVSDLWLDFAVARAFVGSADDGLHQPELRTLADAARVPVDWDIPWPTRPRRLAARSPVYPTGSSYLVVRRSGGRPDARLRVEIEWEQHALFRWALVKIDAHGRELGRVLVPTTERATEARATLTGLEAVDRVLVVGVNVGDPAYAFDPDDAIWEPHGWIVDVAEEPPP